jgi:hypothetical protein
MSIDITRNTFNPTKRFSSVRKLQGRVELDSDFNEAMDILLYHQRAVAADLIGQHGTPPVTDGAEGGFYIQMNDPEGKNFSIGRGRYYVDGILCENDGRKDANGNLVDFTYLTQPDYPQAPALPDLPFIVYLDVWERHITALEDDDIREKALVGPDTASRTKVVWQVKVADGLPDDERLPDDATCEFVKERWAAWVETWRSQNRGMLKAATGDVSDADFENPCITPPEARYRGAENQLYRVEVHASGKAGDATIKWSRDNASSTYPVTLLAGGEVTLGYLGRDSRHGIEPGQWVELVDDNLALQGEVRPLGKVKAVDRERMMVTVEWPEDPDLPTYDREEEYKSKHVLLRRWDHTDRESVPGQPNFDPATGTLFIEESDDPDSNRWLALENGIRISFSKSAGEDHYYQSGDYWLIPARVATGDVEWPWERDASGDVVMSNNRPVPEKRPPHGVEHHYAPLAVITFAGENEQAVEDCRHKVNSVIVSDYDLRRTALDTVRFTEQDADGAERNLFNGFQPRIIIAHGYCNLSLGDRVADLGGMVWAFADNRNGAPMNSCSGFSMKVFSDGRWVMSSILESGLCYAVFKDNSFPVNSAELSVVISSWSPFTVTFHKALSTDVRPSFPFSIVLNVYGLG